jgi:hypothetical protein
MDKSTRRLALHEGGVPAFQWASPRFVMVSYLRDRICGAPDLHRLVDRIADQARARALDASWPERASHPAWQPVRVQSWRR